MEQKGDLLICDLWQNGTNSVHEMRVVNTDDISHLAKIPEKSRQEVERSNKRYTWRPASSNVNTFFPSLTPLMGYWE